MRKSILLLVLLLLSSVCLKAQNIQIDQDFGIWMGLRLEKKLPKNFEVFLEQQLRTWKNTTRIDKYWAETGVNYSIDKNFRLNANLRYIHNTNKTRRPENSFRYNVGIELRLKLNKKFRFTFRTQYQQKFTHNKGTYSLKRISNIRFRTKLKFKYNKNHQFYFSTELFVQSTPLTTAFFKKQRFSLGDNIKTKIGVFNLGIGYELSLLPSDFFSLFFVKIIYRLKL